MCGGGKAGGKDGGGHERGVGGQGGGKSVVVFSGFSIGNGILSSCIKRTCELFLTYRKLWLQKKGGERGQLLDTHTAAIVKKKYVG